MAERSDDMLVQRAPDELGGEVSGAQPRGVMASVLASEPSAFITGTVVCVDGGYLLV